ncbi:LpxI family protein [Bartonella ancashensis]|uniref:UDP-2,3-diacylglucosamine pyrophosphatase n=1 Tax=Bartonella ancashensis TaxID=1318743 RepID=A0A0M4L8Q8_9HYPH|nr:UDP-2,3-diacylglucosamine diphosphatase LpxI [Bartonella ancashensis]ALE03888.1 UDP-2,3-diacylglucosamine pyrophosphatase [Bartonella ancashensis]
MSLLCHKDHFSGRTAIIAGSGVLPIAVAKALEQRGSDPFIILLRGEVEPVLYAYEHCELSIVELARLLKVLKEKEICNVVLAGGVKRRPALFQLRFDWITLSILPKLLKVLKKGDDALLKTFVQIVESYGFCVVGAHEIVPDLLAPPEFDLTLRRASQKEKSDILLAVSAAKSLGRLDIGQAAVVIDGKVAALEGAEGTDAMLHQIYEMKKSGKVALQGGILVKCVKPQQDYRFDLPSIGPRTIINAAKSGLSGIAVEANKSLILSLRETVAEANKSKLFIETFEISDNG